MAKMTALVRAAYQQLADMGFRYWGTWQDENDTRQRCSEGHCLVVEDQGNLIGTVTVKQSKDAGDPGWYLRDGVWIVTQFAVLPALQSKGIGSRLMEEAERYVFDQGGVECALDTAEGAAQLIDYYAKRGYRRVDSVDWDGTNYVSVVMSKRIRPVLTTARLVLRDLNWDDFDAVNGYWGDSRFQERYQPGSLTEELCRETFEWAIKGLQEYPRRGCWWAITLDEDTIGRLRMEVSRSRVGQVGYELHPEWWGKGHMTEAVREAIRFAFQELRLHKIEAWVFANNLASQGVLKKLGFVHEGTLREHAAWGDGRMDDMLFGLLRSEWAQA